MKMRENPDFVMAITAMMEGSLSQGSISSRNEAIRIMQFATYLFAIETGGAEAELKSIKDVESERKAILERVKSCLEDGAIKGRSMGGYHRMK